MADSAISAPQAPQPAAVSRRRMLVALAAAVSVLGGSLVVQDRQLALALAILAGLMALPAFWVAAAPWRAERRERRRARDLAALIETDFCPVVVTDADGRIELANHLAREQLGADPGRPLAEALRDRLADPARLFSRLRARAAAGGRVRQEISGLKWPLLVGVVRLAGAERFLWRLEDAAARPRAPEEVGAALPWLLTDREGREILSMSAGLRNRLRDPGAPLERIVVDPPIRPGEVHVLRVREGLEAMRFVPQPQPTGEVLYHLVPGEPGQGDWSQFDALPIPILKLSPAGRVLTANRPARSLLGVEALVGRDLVDLVEGLGRPVEDWLRDIAEGRSVTRPEVVRASCRQDEVYLQISVRPMQGAGAGALLAVLSDATELKTLEAQFVQSQKMQAIGQLAGGVAHDFNNLLTAISGHCDLLLLRRDSTDPDYADLMQINQNANRAASLVSQLLAFSRKQTLQLETLDVRETLADMTHLLNRLVGEKVRLTLRHDPDLEPIRADRRQLEQVLMNLVVNARDAMPDGGMIEIDSRMCRLREPLRRDRATVPAGSYVMVRVRDHGMGIPPENLSKIFEPFFTTKRTGEGTGLGLSTAYGIVKQSGGFIFVDSVPGEGTCFTLYFPSLAPRHRPAAVAARKEGGRALPQDAALAAAAEPAQPAGTAARGGGEGASAPPPSGVTAKAGGGGRAPRGPGARRFASSGSGAATAAGGGGTTAVDRSAPVDGGTAEDGPIPDRLHGACVLLVEDEAPVRAFAARALRIRGHRVLEAASGEAALEILKDPALRVDVFVTDVVMPGLDGPSWVLQALEGRPEARVIFVSGYSEESLTRQRGRIPNAAFLPKPFSLAQLLDAVQTQLMADAQAARPGS